MLYSLYQVSNCNCWLVLVYMTTHCYSQCQALGLYVRHIRDWNVMHLAGYSFSIPINISEWSQPWHTSNEGDRLGHTTFLLQHSRCLWRLREKSRQRYHKMPVWCLLTILNGLRFLPSNHNFLVSGCQVASCPFERDWINAEFAKFLNKLIMMYRIECFA